MSLLGPLDVDSALGVWQGAQGEGWFTCWMVATLPGLVKSDEAPQGLGGPRLPLCRAELLAVWQAWDSRILSRVLLGAHYLGSVEAKVLEAWKECWSWAHS